MSLEDRIRRLTEDIIACRDEAEAVILTRDLGITLHEHIKRLRGNSPSRCRPALVLGSGGVETTHLMI